VPDDAAEFIAKALAEEAAKNATEATPEIADEMTTE
jgi:hypothetical protein